MELVLHYMYVVAIKDAKAWQNDTPFELSMIGVWNLFIVWLKVRWYSQRIHATIDLADTNEMKASASMALLPPLGACRRNRPP